VLPYVIGYQVDTSLAEEGHTTPQNPRKYLKTAERYPRKYLKEWEHHPLFSGNANFILS